MEFFSLTITPATRLAANSTPSSKKKAASAKRTHVSDSEPESEAISVAGSSKPAPKRARVSAKVSSSRTKVLRVHNDIRQESGSTSEADTKPIDSYANSVDELADTPGTTVSPGNSSSTRDKGKGKAIAVPDSRFSTHLSAEVTNSQDEAEVEDSDTMGEPEDESELSEPDYENEENEEDEDEYEDEDEDEIYIPLPNSKGKGKAKANPTPTPARTPRALNNGRGRTASRASSVASTLASITDGGEDSSSEDFPQDIPGDSTPGGNSSVPMTVPSRFPPSRAAPVGRRQRAVRQPQVWGGRRTRV